MLLSLTSAQIISTHRFQNRGPGGWHLFCVIRVHYGILESFTVDSVDQTVRRKSKRLKRRRWLPKWGEKPLKAINVRKEQFINSKAGEVPAGQPAVCIYHCSAPADRHFVVHILQLSGIKVRMLGEENSRHLKGVLGRQRKKNDTFWQSWKMR